MKKVTLYSTRPCTACRDLAKVLESWGVKDLLTIYLDEDPVAKEMILEMGYRKVPQLSIDGAMVADISALTKEDFACDNT